MKIGMPYLAGLATVSILLVRLCSDRDALRSVARLRRPAESTVTYKSQCCQTEKTFHFREND
jgi:hypothetical protein